MWAWVFFLVGCIPTSIHPLYTEKDILFDDTLLGQWRLEDSEDVVWHFQKLGDQGYELTISEHEKVDQYEAHLVQLKEHLWIFFPSWRVKMFPIC
jgi:hypothetical protein